MDWIALGVERAVSCDDKYIHTYSAEINPLLLVSFATVLCGQQNDYNSNNSQTCGSEYCLAAVVVYGQRHKNKAVRHMSQISSLR